MIGAPDSCAIRTAPFLKEVLEAVRAKPAPKAKAVRSRALAVA